MDNKIELTGKGPANSAHTEFGLVPFANVPILRSVPSLGSKVSLFSEQGTRLGSVKISYEDLPVSIVQDSQQAFLISAINESGYNGYVTTKYYSRRMPLTGKVVDAKPGEIASFTYYTSLNSVVTGLFYDGKKHVPAAAFRAPGSVTGYNGGFILEYEPAYLVDLQSEKRKELVKKGSHPAVFSSENMNLLAMTIPASSVPSLIEERQSESLEEVFKQDDLRMVAELNKMYDLKHRPNCFGDCSCISTETFEFVGKPNYPKYRVSMDNQGRIYHAKRFIDTDPYCSEFGERLTGKTREEA